MPIRNNYLIARLYLVIERLFLPLLGRFVKRPNHLTFIGVGIALLVPIGFYIDPILGLSLMVISGFFDMMDGVMAKAQKKETLFGALLDSSFDRISDLCYLIGFWILFW
jgi:phosphatidylglycerophosphate synthase